MLALVTATKNSMRTVRDALESAASFRHKVNAIRRLWLDADFRLRDVTHVAIDLQADFRTS